MRSCVGNFQNMADVCKVCVESEETISELHKELKEVIHKKLDEKGWSEDKKEEFRREIIKIYEDTVELSLRENVIKENVSSNVVVQQEMEPVNTEKAIEVNKMCAESEDLLTRTIKKRKHYPKRITDALQKQHESEFEVLCDLEKKEESIDPTSLLVEKPLDMTDCQDHLQKLQKASENLSLLVKTLSETKEKAHRLQTSTQTFMKLKGNEINKTLFNKRPLTFESVLATPTKHNESIVSVVTDNTTTETWADSQGPSRKLRCIGRQKTPAK